MTRQVSPCHLARVAGVSVLSCSLGCTAIVTQIPPSDLASLEKLESREDREQAYEEHRIVRHKELSLVNYTKGDALNSERSGWASLDLVLRSDRNSAAALPEKRRRTAGVMVGLAAAGGVATTAGIAATAGEGLDTTRLTGAGVLLIGGAVATVAFAIAGGVLFGKMRRDYEEAIEVYNASLSMRLGLAEADGTYRPPGGVLVDPDGFIVLSPSGSYIDRSQLDAFNARLNADSGEASRLEPDPSTGPADGAEARVPADANEGGVPPEGPRLAEDPAGIGSESQGTTPAEAPGVSDPEGPRSEAPDEAPDEVGEKAGEGAGDAASEAPEPAQPPALVPASPGPAR